MADNEEFDGFQIAIHGLQFGISKLRLYRHSCRVSLGSDDPIDEIMGSYIRGSAGLRNDSIVVIGNKSLTSREFDFRLVAAERGVEQRRKSFEGHYMCKPERPDDESYMKVHKFLQSCYTHSLEFAPPTASIGYFASDTELRIRASWSVEAEISNDVYQALVHDLERKRVREATIRIAVRPTLSRYPWASAGHPDTIGLLPYPGDESVFMPCTVENFGWTAYPKRKARKKETAADNSNVDIVPVQPDSLELVRFQVSSLAKTVRTGFVIVLVLIALTVIF